MHVARTLLDALDTESRATVRDTLRSLEAELHRPIMIVNHGLRYMHLEETGWSDTHIEDFRSNVNSEYTIEDAEEHGIIIADYSPPSRRGYSFRMGPDQFPLLPEFTSNGEAGVAERNAGAYVEYPVNAEPTGAEVWLDADAAVPVATVQRQGVRMHWTLLHFVVYPLIDLAAVLDTVVRKCLDDEFFTEMEERQQRFNMERFAHFHRTAPTRGTERLRIQVQDLETQYQMHLNNMTDTKQHLEERRGQLEYIAAQAGNVDIERVSRDWQALVDHPRTTSVRFINDNTLEITTDTVTLHHPEQGPVALMGQFRIVKDLSTPHLPTIENLSSMRNNRHHPHVPHNGAPCYGGIEQTIFDAIRDAEYLAMFEYLLEFLESYNPRDDWGRFAAWWIEAPYNPDNTPNDDGSPRQDRVNVDPTTLTL